MIRSMSEAGAPLSALRLYSTAGPHLRSSLPLQFPGISLIPFDRSCRSNGTITANLSQNRSRINH